VDAIITASGRGRGSVPELLPSKTLYHRRAVLN
jgi:hypothetical protein